MSTKTEGDVGMQELIREVEQVHSHIAKKGEYCQRLLTSIIQRTARVGVVGLGYVGLSLATEWARAGFSVTGIDIDPQRVRMCQQGKSWIADVSSEDLGTLVREGFLNSTVDLTV